MSADVIDLDEYRRKKQSENAGKRLRGRGFPDDFLVGPDEVGEVVDADELMLLNLSLDNPNFPYPYDSDGGDQ